MNGTIDYYNANAEQYYQSTVDVDFEQLRKKFVSYLPERARIIDIGCGSGRDVKAFCDMGYQAIGLDASEKLARIARKQLGIEVIVADMATWIADEPFDGIWCCASLLHLNESDAELFFDNLQHNLKSGGILFLSVKEGIQTGFDEKGRFMQNYTEAELREKIKRAGLGIIKMERTVDKLGRDDFAWLNAFVRMLNSKEVLI